MTEFWISIKTDRVQIHIKVEAIIRTPLAWFENKSRSPTKIKQCYGLRIPDRGNGLDLDQIKVDALFLICFCKKLKPRPGSLERFMPIFELIRINFSI